MTSFKRQTTALGLLMLAALPVLISVTLFVRQSIIHRNREARFELETLQTITVSSKEVIWLKAGKEILHNGKMFDVKSYKNNGTNVELTGFYDQKEDNLVKDIKGFVQQKEDSRSKVNYLVVKFFFSPKYNDISTFSMENSWLILKHKFPFYDETSIEASHPTAAPPPKAC